MHGKGYGGSPPVDSAIELVLVNAQWQLRRVDGSYPDHHSCPQVPTSRRPDLKSLGKQAPFN
jgi:hypothetical protein